MMKGPKQSENDERSEGPVTLLPSPLPSVLCSSGLTLYIVRPTHVNRTEGEGNERRKERPRREKDETQQTISKEGRVQLENPFSSSTFWVSSVSALD